MGWIQEALDDQSVFPIKVGEPFPKNFPSVVKQIFKRLFRVYAHIYHNHFDKVLLLKEEAHMNSSFKRNHITFIFFLFLKINFFFFFFFFFLFFFFFFFFFKKRK